MVRCGESSTGRAASTRHNPANKTRTQTEQISLLFRLSRNSCRENIYDILHVLLSDEALLINVGFASSQKNGPVEQAMDESST